MLMAGTCTTLSIPRTNWSFARARHRTHLLIDIRQKGGVDAPIYELLSFLNGLPDYVSTSSCSGRVAVFSESPDRRKDVCTSFTRSVS